MDIVSSWMWLAYKFTASDWCLNKTRPTQLICKVPTGKVSEYHVTLSVISSGLQEQLWISVDICQGTVNSIYLPVSVPQWITCPASALDWCSKRSSDDNGCVGCIKLSLTPSLVDTHKQHWHNYIPSFTTESNTVNIWLVKSAFLICDYCNSHAAGSKQLNGMLSTQRQGI